jgi:GntR family transcriptional regulator
MARKKQKPPKNMGNARLVRRSGLTLARQLYMLLRRQIDEGFIPPGAMLPSEPDLAIRYGIARMTVRRALAQLQKDGLIDRGRGRGTRVRKREVGPNAATLASLMGDLRSLGRRTQTRLLRYRIEDTPPAVLSYSPGFGTSALVIQRTRSFAGRPFVLVTHYIPERFAPLVTRNKLGNRATVIAFEDAGVHAKYGEQLVTALAADDRISRALRIGPGAPVLAVRRFVHSSAGDLIEYQEALYPPELYMLRMPVARVDTKDGQVRWLPDRARAGAVAAPV